jgi:hypothetical protein
VTRGMRLLALAALASTSIFLGAGVAGAATQHRHHHHSSTCTGTLTAPGVLAGTYRGNVRIVGVCTVNGGAAVVRGNVIVTPGSVLNATFALNDVAGSGTSSLYVKGDIKVEQGAVLGMGCEPQETPCSDDPNASTGGTLTGINHVSGDVRARGALAVIVHASTIRGDLIVNGGGGGLSCAVPTSGIFAELGSPVFTDAEDNTIGGDLKITNLQTCWLGALRNHVRGSILDARNTMADPDADEVLANVVRGSMACYKNTPAVQYGDSGSTPNQVRGRARGECGFKVLQPNPAPTSTTPAGPLEPISIKLKHWTS